MSKAKFILRCDDVSEHMNLEKWVKVFSLCDKFNVKPILAVIPDVKDPELLRLERVTGFWDRVVLWKSQGYEIALHGLSHLYSSNSRGLITPRPKSEFSGLDLKEQIVKIEMAISIFRLNGLDPKVFIAPGHSFDNTTLEALKLNGINVISDGFFRVPIFYRGLNWIPQQLWKGETKKSGVWTICTHPNTMGEKEFIELEKFISNNHENFTTINDLEFDRDLKEIFYHKAAVLKSYIKFFLKKVFNILCRIF